MAQSRKAPVPLALPPPPFRRTAIQFRVSAPESMLVAPKAARCAGAVRRRSGGAQSVLSRAAPRRQRAARLRFAKKPFPRINLLKNAEKKGKRRNSE